MDDSLQTYSGLMYFGNGAWFLSHSVMISASALAILKTIGEVDATDARKMMQRAIRGREIVIYGNITATVELA